MYTLKKLLEMSSAQHKHLCPRQVLGVRMGMYAIKILNLNLHQNDKRLFTFIETDGCALDGVSVATGCWVGRRTMQVLDFGKIAATFVVVHTERAVRIFPHPEARRAINRYAKHTKDRWHAYLEAYQVMPLDELLVAQSVQLTFSIQAIISCEDTRALCDRCGEEIFNEREVCLDQMVLCRSCAGGAYFEPIQGLHLCQDMPSYTVSVNL
jgi:formylmethanofuran dehydrogenase subunit E